MKMLVSGSTSSVGSGVPRRLLDNDIGGQFQRAVVCTAVTSGNAGVSLRSIGAH